MTQSREAKDVFAQFREFVSSEDPVVTLALKGHLAVEAILDLVVAEQVTHPELLADARLSFHQKRLMGQSMTPANAQHRSWDMVATLNRLRNHMGHNLSPEKTEDLIIELGRQLKALDRGAWELIPDPENNRLVLEHVISYLIGFLGAYHGEMTP